METVKLKTPITKEDIKGLKYGMKVLITGYIYMARDAAHKRMIEALQRGENLPFEVKNQTIYYAWTPMHQPFWIWG